jgi:hypothetical protein
MEIVYFIGAMILLTALIYGTLNYHTGTSPGIRPPIRLSATVTIITRHDRRLETVYTCHRALLTKRPSPLSRLLYLAQAVWMILPAGRTARGSKGHSTKAKAASHGGLLRDVLERRRLAVFISCLR